MVDRQRRRVEALEAKRLAGLTNDPNLRELERTHSRAYPTHS